MMESLLDEEQCFNIENNASVIDFLHLCRICACSSDYCIPIFEGEGLEHELAMKIQKYLPIKICETDTLPLQVCYQCASTLIAWHDLLKNCIEAENKLLELQAQQSLQDKIDNCEEPDDAGIEEQDSPSTSQTKENLADENTERDNIIEIDTGQPENIATDDNGVSDDTAAEDVTSERYSHVSLATGKSIPQKTLKNENNACIVSNSYLTVPRKTVCIMQGKTSNVKGLSVSMYDSKAYSELVNSSKQPDKSLQKVCDLFDLNIRRGKRIRMAIVKRGTPKRVCSFNTEAKDNTDKNDCYSCKRCNIIFPNKREYRKHSEHCVASDITSPHVSNANVDLPTKEKIIISKTACTQEGKNPDKLYQCEECGKNFAIKDNYMRHKRIHTGERPFTCRNCGRKFRDSGGLARHFKDVHSKIKNFACDICSRSFASRATRDDHRRIHTEERPYICDSCGKSFKTKASLYIHKKVHVDSFPFLCSYCGKRFRRKHESVEHSLVHTGLRPYNCEFCCKSFKRLGELRRHKLVHSNCKSYVCNICNLSFSQNRYLKNHEKSKQHKHRGKLVTEDNH